MCYFEALGFDLIKFVVAFDFVKYMIALGEFM